MWSLLFEVVVGLLPKRAWEVVTAVTFLLLAMLLILYLLP